MKREAARAGERYEVVTDAGGNVVGHGAVGDGAGEGPWARFSPRPGQTVHELVLPPVARRRTLQSLVRLVERGEWRRHVTGTRTYEDAGTRSSGSPPAGGR
jgi:hypothetical protein